MTTADASRVGCVTASATSPGADLGYRARIARANAAGGVRGRTIDLVCSDSDGSAAQGLAAVQALVEQQQAFALLTNSPTWTSAMSDYANAHEVPTVGLPVDAGFCASRWVFGFHGCVVGDALPDSVPHAVLAGSPADAAFAAAGRDPEGAAVTVVGIDVPTVDSVLDRARRSFESRGATVRSVPAASVTTVDWAPIASGVLATSPDLVFAVLTPDGAAGLGAALRTAGYRGALVSTTYAPNLLAAQPGLASGLEGTYLFSSDVPLEEDSAWSRQLQADVQAAGSPPSAITLGTLQAYAQADLLLQMLEAAGPTLDTRSFDTAVNGSSFLYVASAAGGPGALAFPEGHFLLADCSAVVAVNGGKVVPAARYACSDSVVVR